MNTTTNITDADIWATLESVKDPEIPVLSVVDMGIITAVSHEGGDTATVTMTPTFVGCPAIHTMKKDIHDAVAAMGFSSVEVIVDMDTAWTSDRMKPEAKAKLEKFGIAPPPVSDGELTAEMLDRVRCPHCGSTDTTLRSTFGSTLCRAIRFCFSCKQGFEQFKPL
ncbi:MAG: phenylacetate-CoA oxygenase subunit PaaJ [Bacteroidetes bacterium]|nr:phenylacetate-CoA oxygenase subunit PaaJ [Bacteroidota bacterium]